METNNSSDGDTQVKQTGTGHLGIVKVRNLSGEDAEARKTSFGRLQPAGAPADFFPLPAGETLHLPAPTGTGAIELRLQNGRILVQTIDARTTRVDLVREEDGSLRTVIASASSEAPPKAAAGGSR